MLAPGRAGVATDAYISLAAHSLGAAAAPEVQVKLPISLVLAAVVVLAVSCRSTTTKRKNLPPLETVDHVDLERYTGLWYEIAAFPQRFQRGCTATTATYALREDGELDVVNRCRKGSPDGPEDVATARARIASEETNAKLKVNFFGPFWGDYWIIDLGPDYEYAVVGHPSRDYLWILSRTPTLPEATYRSIVERLAAQGYETDRLVRTVQPGAVRP